MSVVAEILPAAIAIAASPVGVIPAILVLGSPRPQPAGVAFLGGWVIGLTALMVATTAVASALERGETPTWAIVLRLVLGVLLIGLGVRKWLSRGAGDKVPAWMDSLRSATPGRSLRLALTIALANPKHLMLTLTAGLYAGASDLGAAGLAGAIALFVTVASVSVATPVLAFLTLGARAQASLQQLEAWLIRHNTVLLAGVITLIGLVVVAKALGEL